MSQNNINNSAGNFDVTSITIDPGSSGDSYIQFDINSTGEFRIGVDDTDSDAFCVSLGSALGTNNAFRMSASGELNQPLQPAFNAYLASSDNNVTGNGTIWYLGSTTALTERFDQTSDFNTNGTFTAPVTGKYHLMGQIYWKVETLSGCDQSTIALVTSNLTYFGTNYPSRERVTGFYGPNFDLGPSTQVLADMDAADTARIYVQVTGGPNTADVRGGANPQSYMMGYLAC